MDVAASEFFKSGKYDLDFKSPDDPNRYITHDELANLYKSFIKDYPGECFRAPSPFSSHCRAARQPPKPAVRRQWRHCESGWAAGLQCAHWGSSGSSAHSAGGLAGAWCSRGLGWF